MTTTDVIALLLLLVATVLVLANLNTQDPFD